MDLLAKQNRKKNIKCFGIMTNCYFCRIKCAKMCILQWKLLFNTLITQCFMRHSFFALFHLNRLFVWLVFIVFAHNVQHVNGIHDQKLNRIPNERKIKPMKYFTQQQNRQQNQHKRTKSRCVVFHFNG